MNKIKIIKKNDEYSSEYQIGDTFEIEGTWYGGVHIIGKTGAPVSLDKDEYIYLDANPENKADFYVCNFPPGIVCLNTNQYGYPRSTACFYAFCQYRKK